MPPLISAVIPLPDQNEIHDQSLAALKSQLRYMDSEIVLVGLHKSAQIRSLLNEFRQESITPRFVEIRRPDSPAGAWNRGIESAGGEYILLMQPWIQLHPESLGMMVEYLRGDRNTGLITPQIQYSDATILPHCRRFPTHKDVIASCLGFDRVFPASRYFNGWHMGDFSHRVFREVEGAALLLWLTSKVVWRKVGLFDENFPAYFYETDWCRRLRAAGYTILFYSQAKAYQRGSSQPASVLQRRVSLFRLLDKHYDRIHQQMANLITGLLLYGTLPFSLGRNLFRRRLADNRE